MLLTDERAKASQLFCFGTINIGGVDWSMQDDTAQIVKVKLVRGPRIGVEFDRQLEHFRAKWTPVRVKKMR
ncbi:hypothetical protein [Chelatococcus asaccharovorans]|uniref:Uncharacterized protein n=1 Tax=Chelatococcus asaccharovorans TaxID=28210 RepID=A0A2V3U4I0_9HYPH|nr:hypothetical protein [Chelatococcus asaccharovorans]MBS7703692.1 hypothetical protein [Chelatococcus asaccharovorans]PXW57850.1 hypothetical protein C7450_10622 [Chelatococcus asaccharovorans]